MKTFASLFLCTVLALLCTGAFALEVNDRAPAFTAESTAGTVRLQDYLVKGPVVLAFYFADFTPV